MNAIDLTGQGKFGQLIKEIEKFEQGEGRSPIAKEVSFMARRVASGAPRRIVSEMIDRWNREVLGN